MYFWYKFYSGKYNSSQTLNTYINQQGLQNSNVQKNWKKKTFNFALILFYCNFKFWVRRARKIFFFYIRVCSQLLIMIRNKPQYWHGGGYDK